MDSRQNIPKNFRRNLEKSVESIISNHEAFKTNQFPTSIESIVDNIMQSDELQTLTENLTQENFFYQTEDLNSINDSLGSANHNDIEILAENPLHSLSDHKAWVQEAKVLRERLLSKNIEMFTSSYKVHLRLVSHPQTLNEGIINIIKALKTYFQSTSKQYMSNNFRINLKIGTHTNLLKVTNLLLKSLVRIHKNYKHQIIETIINQLLELITFPTYGKKIDRIHALNYMAILDPKALWFKNLSYNAFDRNVITNFIKKNPSLVEYLVTEIFTNIYAENEFYMKNVYIDEKSEIVNIIIKVATFYHCIHIIGQLLCFSEGRNLFPIKIKLNDEPICAYSLVLSFLDAINSFVDNPSQKRKRNVIIDVLKPVLIANSYLLNHSEVVSKLFAPLRLTESSKYSLPEVTINHLYIFEICEKISLQPEGCYILFGFNGFKTKKKKNSATEKNINSIDKMIKHYMSKEKHSLTPTDYVINFVTAFLRFYVSHHKKYNVSFNLPFIVLDHCRQILTSENHILHWYKVQKLVGSVRDLYKSLADQKAYTFLLRDLEKFIYSICLSSHSLNYLQDEQDIYFLFGTNFLSSPIDFWALKSFNVFILNLADNIYGSEAIYEKMDNIVCPMLEKIWRLEEDELIFLSGSDRLINEAIFKFQRMIVTFTFSTKCFQVVIKENLDDSVTLTDGESKPTDIYNLIEESLQLSGPGTLTNYVGLLALKTLIQNVDIYLYLETKFSILDKILATQQQCVIHSTDRLNERWSPRDSPRRSPQYVIDECSLLRQEIIDHVRHMGLVTYKNVPSLKKTHSSHSLVVTSRKQISELQRFLKETKNHLHDNGWMVQARRAHKLVIDEVMREIVLIEIIKQASQLYPSHQKDFVWPAPETELRDLYPEELLGVSVIIKYGVHNKLIQNCSQNEESLILLLKQTRLFLKQPKEAFNGFDWFTSIIFLICGGNIDKTKSTLSCLVEFPTSPYIWPALRGHEKSSCWAKFECSINVILHEVEDMSVILEAAHISVAGMVQFLLNQCFLNVYDWNEISQFLVMSLIYTPDYLVYYFVAMFMYIKDAAVKATIYDDLTIYDKILHLDGFKMKTAIPVMESLAKQYKCFLN